jgi:hypothetical protein
LGGSASDGLLRLCLSPRRCSSVAGWDECCAATFVGDHHDDVPLPPPSR